VRGIVAGSDSWLLLFSTLPKAWLFKSVVSTFLLPVYAMLSAVCGMFLSWVIVHLEDSAQGIVASFPLANIMRSDNPTPPKLRRAASSIFKFPSQLKQKLTTKTTMLEMLQRFLMAISISGILRLCVYAIGLHKIAALGTSEVNLWQLASEPVFFFYLARFADSLNSTLSKTVWKKGPAPATPPLTLWRTRPAKDTLELLAYAKSRALRSYTGYREQAVQILLVLVEDVFNFVIFARAVILVFDLSPLLRAIVSSIGFASTVDQHKTWFFQATGFQEESIGNKYVTDRLLNFGFWNAGVGLGVIGNVVVEDDPFAVLRWQQITWRLLVPALFFLLQSRWNLRMKKQQLDFKTCWKGTDWKDGCYAEMLDKFGSYWKEVPKAEWSIVA